MNSQLLKLMHGALIYLIILYCFSVSTVYADTLIPEIVREQYPEALPSELTYRQFAELQYERYIRPGLADRRGADLHSGNQITQIQAPETAAIQAGLHALHFGPPDLWETIYHVLEISARGLLEYTGFLEDGINCYAYACNRGLTVDYKGISRIVTPEPGEFRSPIIPQAFQGITPDVVLLGALRDGLSLTPIPSVPSYPVYFVVAPGEDYHWYRLDANVFWSHKPGRTQVSLVDASNNPILNPLRADHDYSPIGHGRINYSESGCFLWVPHHLKSLDQNIFQLQPPPPGCSSFRSGRGGHDNAPGPAGGAQVF